MHAAGNLAVQRAAWMVGWKAGYLVEHWAVPLVDSLAAQTAGNWAGQMDVHSVEHWAA